MLPGWRQSPAAAGPRHSPPEGPAGIDLGQARKNPLAGSGVGGPLALGRVRFDAAPRRRVEEMQAARRGREADLLVECRRGGVVQARDDRRIAATRMDDGVGAEQFDQFDRRADRRALERAGPKVFGPDADIDLAAGPGAQGRIGEPQPAAIGGPLSLAGHRYLIEQP